MSKSTSSDERRPFVLRDRLAITPLPVRADEVILIETEDEVQRTTVREKFDSFERDLDDFEALKVCVG